MMKYLLLILILLSSYKSWAEPISKDKARQIAEAFMIQKGRKGTLSFAEIKANRTRTQTDALLYIFNVANQQGFVIVSGDSQTPKVLAYALHGYFDTENMPENLAGWIDEYAEQIKHIKEQYHQGNTRVDNDIPYHSPVEEMIKTKWNQYAPYYNQCPFYDDKRCLTGCLTTSLAQVMYYNRWPIKTSRTILAYTTKTYKIPIERLPITSFDWDEMTEKYDEQSTEESEEAVSILMKYCGSALQADYGPNSTSAYWSNIKEALRWYFGYGDGVREISRNYYDDIQWDSIVYQEIIEQRPILYYGKNEDDKKSSHAFIIHGYDGQGYYAVNWGWGGKSDGYYMLSAMNPKNKTAKYNVNQSAWIGITKEDLSDATQNAIISGVYVSSPSKDAYKASTHKYQGTIDSDNSLSFSYAFKLYSDMVNNNLYDFRVALFKEGEILQTITIEENMVIKSNRTAVSSGIMTLNNLNSDGDYQLKVYCRQSGTEDWYQCIGANKHLIIINIYNGTALVTSSNATTSIRTIYTDTDDDTVKYFDLKGRKINSSYKGVVIKKKRDGSTQKIIR